VSSPILTTSGGVELRGHAGSAVCAGRAFAESVSAAGDAAGSALAVPAPALET
jgi:hypothetical protein